ncbi:YggU-like protein [Cadophora sp. DSE1049]|nr:YggU-like protein [Cadophora sp. DSE1049]
MTSLPAIRHVASSVKSAFGFIHIQCHVRPGASKQRQGIMSVSDSVIEVCVSAQPRDGEANKAVRELFSDVLKCPKSDVEVIRGLKSRDKTVAVAGFDVKGDEKSCIAKIRDQLQSAVR